MDWRFTAVNNAGWKFKRTTTHHEEARLIIRAGLEEGIIQGARKSASLAV
jgi:hypothetical protein